MQTKDSLGWGYWRNAPLVPYWIEQANLGQLCQAVFCDGLHLYSPSVNRLRNFGAKIGLKPEWLQVRRMTHFDVSRRKAELAVAMGAIPCSPRDIVRVARRVRAIEERMRK